jgi:hypothetical protein
MAPEQENTSTPINNEPVVQPSGGQPQPTAPETPAVPPATVPPAQTPEALPETPPAEPASAAPVPSAPPAPQTPPAAVVGGGFVPESSQGGAVVGGADLSDQAPVTKRRPIKAVLTALLVVLLVGAGSAAAYVGIIVPNKPENVLKAATLNTIQAKESSFKGSLEGDPMSTSGVAYKIGVDGSQNTNAKASEAKLNITVSGVTFPIEARLVNSSIYVRVGDLKTITGLISTFSPEAGAMAQKVSSQLSNQWVLFDSTLLKQAGGSCALDMNWGLTKADAKLLGAAYDRHQFADITKTSSDKVNGKKVTKYTISIDDDKGAAFGNDKSLDKLSFVSELNKCDKSLSSNTSDNLKGDHKHTTLTIWVDKGKKRIAKVEYKTTAQAAAMTFSGTFGYDKVSITAPTGAKPAVQVLTELQAALGGPESGVDLTQLLNVGGGTQTKAKDSKRQTDMSSLQTQLEAYFSMNGNYPSLSQMNDANWVKTNMSSLDTNALQDPDGSSTKLVATPAKNFYAYQPTTATGGSCESKPTSCTKYTLTATLSDGTTSVKANLD